MEIERTILAEENRFDAVLKDGLPRLEAEIQKALGLPERTLPGETAFRLYDTFGVPYDFIEDTAATQDVRVDKAGFEALMSTWGISNDTTVVFYGDRNNWYAAYSFWLFKYYGHEKALIMNGGRGKWTAEGRPTTDPGVLYRDPRGTILPLGGPQAYKGFGLGLMLDVLCGGLTQAGFDVLGGDQDGFFEAIPYLVSAKPDRKQLIAVLGFKVKAK